MEDPITTFVYMIMQIRNLYPDFAFLHIVEPRVSGGIDAESTCSDSNDIFRTIWSPRPFISAGGYDRSSAIDAADNKGDLIAFGRHFISNVSLICLNYFNAASTHDCDSSLISLYD